jgi:hypothetical protein
MANEEHLALLKQRVGVWNKCRDPHLRIVVDFSGTDLSWENLSETDLCETKPIKADLSSSQIPWAKLHLTWVSNYQFGTKRG